MTAWSFASLAFLIIGLAMLARFRSGRWRRLRLVETAVAATEAIGIGA